MTLEKRIEILENKLKLKTRKKVLTWVGFVALIVIVNILNHVDYISAHSNSFDEIRVKRIVLTDQDGLERAVLALDEGKGMVGLVMRDEPGGASAVLGASGLDLRDKNGKSRLALTLNAGEPGLVLFGQNSKERALLLVDKKGPALSLRNNKGVGRWITPASKK